MTHLELEKNPHISEINFPSEHDNFSYLAGDAPHFSSILSFQTLTTNTCYVTFTLLSHQMLQYIKESAASRQTALGGT